MVETGEVNRDALPHSHPHTFKYISKWAVSRGCNVEVIRWFVHKNTSAHEQTNTNDDWFKFLRNINWIFVFQMLHFLKAQSRNCNWPNFYKFHSNQVK